MGFDDIGYHFGIDCQGNIYEGRDVRLKGSSVHNFNTGVIGIVLLNNLTTAEEGADALALGRHPLSTLASARPTPFLQLRSMDCST
jgi:hypothetical protein